jgi:hypothetical protein
MMKRAAYLSPNAVDVRVKPMTLLANVRCPLSTVLTHKLVVSPLYDPVTQAS